MANVMLGYNNLVDSATLSGATIVATLPLTNLQNTALAMVTRISGTTGQITVDFGSARPVRVLGVFGVGMASADTIRHRLSAVSATGGELLDTTAVASNVQTGYGQSLRVLSASVNARWWRMDFDAPSLTALNYIDIGRIFAGNIWQPQFNYALGAEEAFEDDSRISYGARSGAAFVDLGVQKRTLNLNFEAMNDSDRSELRELQRVCGTRGQLLALPDADVSAAELNRSAVLGRLRTLSARRETGYGVYAASLSLLEDK